MSSSGGKASDSAPPAHRVLVFDKRTRMRKKAFVMTRSGTSGSCGDVLLFANLGRDFVVFSGRAAELGEGGAVIT